MTSQRFIFFDRKSQDVLQMPSMALNRCGVAEICPSVCDRNSEISIICSIEYPQEDIMRSKYISHAFQSPKYLATE